MAEIVVEAETLDEARAQAAARVPAGEMLLSERIEADGRPSAIRAAARTVADAWRDAIAKVPDGAVVTEKKILRDPSLHPVVVEADDEPAARAAALAAYENATVLSIVQEDPGKRGFLGFGRRAPSWRAEVLSQASVEVQYRRKARIVIRAGTRPESWDDLIAVFRSRKGSGPGSASDLLDLLPYHAHFLAVSGHADDPRAYKDIPFVTVTPELVRAARRLIENPKLPAMMAMFSEKLDGDRYRIVDKHIGRMSNPPIDSAIITAVDCLPRRRVSPFDGAELARLAFEAIKHYAQIPIVRFCFSLPHIDQARGTRQIELLRNEIDIYKGTEAILLEVWDEIAEGEVITSERVRSKVRNLLLTYGGKPSSAPPVIPVAAEPSATATIDGVRFPLLRSVEAFAALIGKENRGALRFRSVEYRSVLSRVAGTLPEKDRDDVVASVLVCAGCMWQFPGSYMLALQMRDTPMPFVSGATPGFDRFGETGACPQCGSEESVLVFERFPPDEITQRDVEAIRDYWRELAQAWWQGQSRSEGICDLCNEGIARGEGYLSGSDLTCGGCVERGLMTDGLQRLRDRPHHYGAALLRKARAARA